MLASRSMPPRSLLLMPSTAFGFGFCPPCRWRLRHWHCLWLCLWRRLWLCLVAGGWLCRWLIPTAVIRIITTSQLTSSPLSLVLLRVEALLPALFQLTPLACILVQPPLPVWLPALLALPSCTSLLHVVFPRLGLRVILTLTTIPTQPPSLLARCGFDCFHH